MRRFAFVLALALVIAGSPALASNMGFKINKPLYAPVAGSFGNNYVSITYHTAYTSAAVMFADIPSVSTVLHQITNALQQTPACLPATPVNGFEVYDGGFSLCDFPIVDGEGYVVQVFGAATQNWVMVGSHNPAATAPLYAPVGGSFGNNYISVPYHTTQTSAAGLFAELAAQSVSTILHQITSAVQQTPACLPATPVNGFEVYDGGFSLCDFPITAGEAHVIQIFGAATQNWSPAHY